MGETPSAPNHSILDSISVLHVDDEEYQRQFAVMFLEESGMIKVTSVATPHEVLQKLEEEEYDCIVADYKMPDMDGITLARHIKGRRRVPFILYTGRGSEEVAQEAFKAGVDDYLRKETEPSQWLVLEQQIKNLVNRYKTEKSVREIQELLKLQVNMMPIALIFWDTGFRAKTWNPSATRIFGFSEEEAIGKHPYDIIVPKESQPQVDEIWRRLLGGDETTHSVNENTTKDGRTITCAWVNTPLKSDDGTVIGALSMAEDITDRKRLEDELKREHDKVLEHVKELDELRRKLEAMHYSALNYHKADTPEEIAKQTLDTVTKILGFDHASFSIVESGIVHAIAIRGRGRPLPPDQPLDGKGIKARAARTGETQLVPDTRLNGDYVMPPDNVEFLSELAVPVKINHGAVAAINIESKRLNAFTDRDRMLAEMLAATVGAAFSRLRRLQERTEYERRLEALHRHSAELELAGDVQQICELTLDAMEQALDFEYSSFLLVEKGILKEKGARGTPLLDIPLPLDGKGITVKAVNTKQTMLVNDLRGDLNFVRGPIDSLSELAVPVLVGGEIIAILNLESPNLNAFTEGDRRLTETLADHVAYAFERLKAEEKERKRETAKARELLEAANRLSSMTRHDLQGPLQTIKNSSYLIRKSPEKAEKYTKFINDAVDSATKMLGELKFGVLFKEQEIILADLNDLVEQSLLGVVIPETVKVVKEMSEPIMVSVEPVSIKRVVYNLAKNAVEAMPSGGVLTIQVKKAGKMALLIVGDNGVGVKPEAMKNLFTPFYSTNVGGRGLGLFTCKQAVEANEGTISVESEAGKGTTFTVKLPYDKSNQKQPSQA